MREESSGVEENEQARNERKLRKRRGFNVILIVGRYRCYFAVGAHR